MLMSSKMTKKFEVTMRHRFDASFSPKDPRDITKATAAATGVITVMVQVIITMVTTMEVIAVVATNPVWSMNLRN